MPFTAADTIRILVATDSHVGYAERDAIRKDDSWRSFDEVMQLARTEDVDMVLLAGDLFHDNKPSRQSMYQVMRSLRQNCLGEKPCELELLSDASEAFNGNVNYEDPDINVAIPVFSIHGNHDDPTGDGHLCSLDLLQASGLLNYFGRMPESDKFHIKPVLLQKGQTKMSLYGMSNVRDERLYRTFRDRNVKWFKPGQQQQDWFNLIAVHQNHYAHSETGYLPENFIPDFMDLVVWGHEHECLIDPRLNSEQMFHVMQPGSSIATSLVPGEAVAKHVAIVSVTGKDFKIEKHRIKSVRPFITKDLILANDDRFRGIDKIKDNKNRITIKLIAVVEELIAEAVEEWKSIQEEEVLETDIPLPLVRLKIEYSAPDGGKYEIENPQRFSNRFVGKVANVKDVVQFYRKKVASRKNNTDKDMPDADVLQSLAENSNLKVAKLVHEYLSAQSLKILPQAQFGDAVAQFVKNDDKYAMQVFIDQSLAYQVKDLMNLGADENEDFSDIMEQLRAKQDQLFKSGVLKNSKKKGTLKPEPVNWDADMDGPWEDQPGSYVFDENEENDEEVAPAKRGRAQAIASDDDASIVSAPTGKKAPAKKAPAKRAPAKSKAAAKSPAKTKAPAKAPARGRNKVLEPSDDDEDDDDDVVMLDEAPPPKAQPKRAATAKGRQTQLSFTQTQRKTQTTRELSDDEISDDDDAFEPAASSSRKR